MGFSLVPVGRDGVCVSRCDVWLLGRVQPVSPPALSLSVQVMSAGHGGEGRSSRKSNNYPDIQDSHQPLAIIRENDR